MSSRSIPGWLPKVLAVACVLVACELAEARRAFAPRRFVFKIDPNTPLKELLPTPPDAPVDVPSLLNEDLSKVREATFGAPIYADGKTDVMEKMAHTIAKINHVNLKETDGFMKALTATRRDLTGLPFRMGKECRTNEEEARVFATVVELFHHSSQMIENRINARSKNDKSEHAKPFWEQFPAFFAKECGNIQRQTRHRDTTWEAIDRAKVAVLMQTHIGRSETYRVGLAVYLSTIENGDASRALGRLALYSPEEQVRDAALAGLKKRQPKTYTGVLAQGLHYPLPAVAQRAADALVKLEVRDAVENLVEVLDRPDPRAPAKATINGKEESIVNELVRVNHQRNCVLCHAPANTKDVPQSILTAPVTLPGAEASPSGGYGRNTSPDIFVRIDMTYLRQDFSLMMEIDDARPWHAKERYDFFVRTRVLTAKEATEAAKLFENRPSPYHAAAHQALRALTGRDAEPTAQAWRKVLKP